MEAPNIVNTNPLGLSLDFMFGRGYLWAERQRLSDWITLESLRMEIPDLKFPFDARQGLDRFRHTRCLVRHVEFAISEVGLGDLLTQAAAQLEGFRDLQVRFLDDAAHISLRMRAFGVDTHLSFRAALIPPEPARADEVHLSLYDYRAYGPLPYPSRLLAYELLTSLLNTPTLRPPGRGESFAVGVAGDIITFRPLKLLFLHIFPRVGWKLPNLAGVVLESAVIRPGVVTIRAVFQDDAIRRPKASSHQLATSPEGARALVAYESKDLFGTADQALFDGNARQALNLLSNYRDFYGLHPELVTRLLDCLLADPTAENVAEADAICRELLREDSHNLAAALARPILASVRRHAPELAAAFENLSEVLRRRHETQDWILCELAAAHHLEEHAPNEAVTRLRNVLKVAPRNRAALEHLRTLYERLGEGPGLEETLKRLTGVYTDRDTLKATYLTLARHLLDRSGDLSEARMYLERVLRLDPTDLDALKILGESYVLADEPLRALKAFGSASRAAEARGLLAQAAHLHARIARLWHVHLGDADQALLSCRRSLALEVHAPQDPMALRERTYSLALAAHLCQERQRDEEATRYWSELLAHLEQVHDAHLDAELDAWLVQSAEGAMELDFLPHLATFGAADGRLTLLESLTLESQRQLALNYERRGRPHSAAAHWRAVLALDPACREAFDHLESFLNQGGQPEQLIELYTDMLAPFGEGPRAVELHEKLADVYATMGLVDDAQQHLRQAMAIDPTAHGPRQKLVVLLSDHGRYETLRDALTTVLVRLRDRDARFDVLRTLGNVLARHLEQPAAAVRAYLEALQIRPASRDLLEFSCDLLETIVAREGHQAPAPIGSQTASKLLERLLIRLTDLAPTIAQQRELLTRIAILAEARGDHAAAAEARQRIRQFGHEFADPEADPFEDIDARLDALLSQNLAPDDALLQALPNATRPVTPTPDAPAAAATQALPPALAASLERAEAPTTRLPTQQPRPQEPATPPSLRELPPEIASSQLLAIPQDSWELPASEAPAATAPAPAAPTPVLSAHMQPIAPDRDDALAEANLENFRQKFQQLIKRPATLPPMAGIPAIAPSARLPEAPVEGPSQDAPPAPAPPVPPVPPAGIHTDTPPDVRASEREFDTVRLPSLAQPQMSPPAAPVSAPMDAPPAPTPQVPAATPPALPVPPAPPERNPHVVPLLLDQLGSARQADDPELLAAAMARLLAADADPANLSSLSDVQRLGLKRELGEVLYYDLERPSEALPYLEDVRATDPRGAGAQPSVINALESIYEESGRVDARLRLMESRMHAAETPEMATAYRLLMAQLLWDEREDDAGARRWLAEVLAQEPDHEAAHRLLATLDARRGDFAAAAAHLGRALAMSGGGLDAVETERELAEMYLEKLGDPARAQVHFENVLKAAMGDARALQGVKRCQEMAGNWQGYLASLAGEFGLLIGRPRLTVPELVQLSAGSVTPALRVAASQVTAEMAAIAQERTAQVETARLLWGMAYQLWPENVEALEARIALDRELTCHEDLARDLEAYAGLLFDTLERFDVLVESATIWAELLNNPEQARPLYAEAIASVWDAPEPPEGLDAARRALQRLQSDAHRS